MARLIGEDTDGPTRIRWFQDGDQIAIQHSQDIEPLLNRIAATNADGGTPTNEGMGALKYEFPEEFIMEHAAERGLSFKELAYTPCKEMDKEWERMAQKWGKLRIERRRKYFGLSA